MTTLRLISLPNFSESLLAELQTSLASKGFNCSQSDSVPSINLWCIDCAHAPDAQQVPWLEQWLLQYAQQSHLIVFCNLLQADIQQQMRWSQWCREHYPELMILRSHQAGEIDGNGVESILRTLSCAQPKLFQLSFQSLMFETNRISLDHLFMGLSNSVSCLNQKIFSIQGMVETIEYAQPVSINATPLNWQIGHQIHANLQNKILLTGQDLNQQWLQEIIDSSQV